MALHPVILAGGSGTRLWPLSRSHTPKQFLSLTGRHTLFQEVFIRLNGLQDLSKPIVVCNQVHKELIAEQLMALGESASLMILEPEGRNSAPALTLACLALTQNNDHTNPDPIVIAMPSDHIVSDVKGFQKAVIGGINLASKGYIVTFGIPPTCNQVGYGYLRKGPPLGDEGDGTDGSIALKLLDFIEKPDVDTATAFIKSEEYLWNSGIFMMRASIWLAALEHYRPDIMKACKVSMTSARRDSSTLYPDPEAFASCPRESIDYAVMEKVMAGESPGQLSKPLEKQPKPLSELAGCAVIPMDAGWSDVGSWSAVWQKTEKDANGNVLKGNVRSQSVKDSLVIARDRLLVAVGLQDMVIVETPDVVLVAHKDQAQEIKEIVNQLRAEGYLKD